MNYKIANTHSLIIDKEIQNFRSRQTATAVLIFFYQLRRTKALVTNVRTELHVAKGTITLPMEMFKL